MIWGMLGKLVDVGASIFSGIAQNKSLEDAGKQSYDLAMLQRGDVLAQQGQQNTMAAKQHQLGKQGLAFQKSEARQNRKLQKQQLKQEKINRMLGMLGSNTTLTNNVVDMWSKTGIMGGS